MHSPCAVNMPVFAGALGCGAPAFSVSMWSLYLSLAGLTDQSNAFVVELIPDSRILSPIIDSDRHLNPGTSLYLGLSASGSRLRRDENEYQPDCRIDHKCHDDS